MLTVKNFLLFQITYLLTPIHTANIRCIITKKMYNGMTVPVINLHLLAQTYPRQCAQAHVKLSKFIQSVPLMKIVEVYMGPISCVFLSFPFSLDCALQQLITVRPQVCPVLHWFLRHKLYHTKSFIIHY